MSASLAVAGAPDANCAAERQGAMQSGLCLSGRDDNQGDAMTLDCRRWYSIRAAVSVGWGYLWK